MDKLLSGALSLPVDWILLGIVAIWVILKGSRGFYNSLMPFLITLIAIPCAFFVVLLFREQATEAAYNWLLKELLQRMDLSAVRSLNAAQITEQLRRLLPEVLMNIAGKMELDLGAFVSDSVRALGLGAGGEVIAADAAGALLRPVTAAAVRLLLFFGSFFALKLIFGGVARIARLSFSLPGFAVVDRVCGMLLGLLESSVVLFLLFWLMQYLIPDKFALLQANSRILTALFGK